METGPRTRTSTATAPISRRTMLVTASLALLAPTVWPLTPPAQAATPTYGHGYTGGY